MKSLPIKHLIIQKLRERETYLLSLVVGTVINFYGQYLVPWFRGSTSPWDDFVQEASVRPGLMLTSVLLGYAFPFCVGIYSSVMTQYKNQRTQSEE
ncbi:MAG: hypothetical protein VX278_00645 [Myxococcota bacterium]|nr:hypothetical protein [Myxococcota bacterium]